MIAETFKGEEQEKSKGKLKIFLGYAAGSGKTYAMLESAHDAIKSGADVVAGYIEPHDRPDTQALVDGIETISPLMVDYKGIRLQELNLDAALARKPQLILVDELAHTNAVGCRNEKRYQDVQELLRVGINVYTTVNIQHLESLNDLVGSITGIEVRETIPDTLFDEANQVEMIDIEPEELIKRMKKGKIYGEIQAARALENFFRTENLVALREIALRRTADRVNRIAEKERCLSRQKNYHTGEHVLVCITAAPSSAKVIRTAARLASAFHAQFTGLYVETPQMQEAEEKTKIALRKNIELAKLLGAKMVTFYGSDVAAQIAQYAVVSNISKIVLGRTNHVTMRPLYRSELLEKLTYMAPNVDVYIIPDMGRQGRYHPKRGFENRKRLRKTGQEWIGLAAIMTLSTVFSLILQKLSLPEVNLILTNLLILFIWTLIRKLKYQNLENAKKAYRTEILLENSQKLRRCKSAEAVFKQVSAQTGKLLNLSVLIYPMEKTGLAETPLLFPRQGTETAELEKCVNAGERGVACWVAVNRHRAGACTHTLPDAMAMYLPIQDEERVKGVMGIYLEERRPLGEFEYSLLTAMLNETGVKLKEYSLTES